MKEEQKIPTWDDTEALVPTWDDTQEVKKKENGDLVSSEEPTTSEGFEQWELDMFKQFDDNPSSLSTASNIDLRKYREYKKSQGEDRPLVSTPEQEFLASGEVATPQSPILSQAEKDAQAEKESMLKGLSDDEKTIVGNAIDETNDWYAERGGMTPFVKMQELNRRVNELQSDISAEDISRMTTDEIDALDTKYKQSVLDIANELGLSVKEDGTISPYESEVNEFKDRLDFYTRIADDKRKEEGKASFGQDIMNKLASGYEQASANVLDMVGAVTGLNYFDSYKNLSEGGRYNAEKLRSYANRYDGTIEDYLVNGEIGKAAGLAVGGAMESLPSMLPVFVNPQYGLYVMSGMSGIDKYREIEDKDIPEWSKYYNAFITGASEYAGEKIVTIPILKRSKQAIKSLGEKGGKQAIENALKKSVENNAAKFGRMPEWVAEGMSEVATGISTDIVDKVTIDPNTKIGSHAVDDFVVGALMGKVFALPQDLARGMNTLAARDFSRNVLDKLPSDMNTEDKISLGWKIVERNKLQEAEDKLDDAFKGKYQARIVELNGEIADLSAKYNEMQQPTVGTTEEVGEMQSKLDYLQEQGVKVPDGSTAEDVAKLYEETKKEATPTADEEMAKEAEKPTETEEKPSQKKDEFATGQKGVDLLLSGRLEDIYETDSNGEPIYSKTKKEYRDAVAEAEQLNSISPSESTVRMKHGTTSSNAEKIKEEGFNIEVEDEYKLTDSEAEIGTFASRSNNIHPTWDVGGAARMPEYDTYLEFDLSTENAFFANWDNIGKYGGKKWLTKENLDKIKADGYNVVISNDPSLIEGGSQVIILDNSAIVSDFVETSKQELIDRVKSGQPRAEQLKEETKDDEKEVQEQQVQEQDEERQTEKPAEEVEISEKGDEARQEDVVQEVEQAPEFVSSKDTEQYVPTEEIVPYLEHDRETQPKFNQASVLDKLTADIKNNGITSPVTIQVDMDGNALVTEGNTRIAAARRLGIKNIPIKIVRKEFGSINKGKAKPFPTDGLSETSPTEASQPATEAQTQQKGTITPTEEKVAEKRSKAAERAKRVEEINAELGEEWNNLMQAIGGVKNITGEQRKKVIDSIPNIVKLTAEKYALKGADLVDAVRDFLKANNIEIDDELNTKLEKDAAKYESGKVQEKSTEKREERKERDKDLSKGDRSKLQDREKAPKEKVRQRGFDKTQKKSGGVYEAIVKEKPLFYKQRSSEAGIQNAIDWLEDRSEDESYNALKRKGKISPDWQDRRQLFLIHLGSQLDKAVADGNFEQAELIREKYDNVREALATDYTTAGQTAQRGAVWNVLTNRTVTWLIESNIKKANEQSVPEANIDNLMDSAEDINDMAKSVSDNVTEDEEVQKVINEVVSGYKKTKRTNKEKAQIVAKKVRSIKSSNWGITLAADPISSIGIGVMDGAIEVTARTIELTGNVADAIQKGIYQIKQSDWYKGLTKDQQRKIERKFSFNIRKDLGVEKLSNKNLEDYLKVEVKDLKTTLEDLIRKHWAEKNMLGIKLAERITGDLGLKESDAKKIQDAIQKIIDKRVDGGLTEFLPEEDVPKTGGARKSFVQKMGDLMMRGDLDSEIFRDAFSESFGLQKNLTEEQTNYIFNLYQAVIATEDMGHIGDIAADLYAKEIDRLMPENKINRTLKAMIGLGYGNVLFGPATWFVNVMSAAMNQVLAPITKAVDPVQWIEAWKGSKNIADFAALNPVVEGLISYFTFTGSWGGVSQREFRNILKNGDLRAMHKYISEVQSTSKLKVPELERTLNGKYRFKQPIVIKTKSGKQVITNPFELMKYSGRMLAAQDAFVTTSFESAFLAQTLTRKMKKAGASYKEIYDAINKQVYGLNLTDTEKEKVEDTLKKEIDTLDKYGIKYDELQKDKRRMEIIRDMFTTLDESELMDAKNAAKGQVFNDNRGGIVNYIMGAMSRFANKNIYTKLAITPHFMFFKIFGNIGDFAIDTLPIYGTLRYRGWSPTTLIATWVKHRENGLSPQQATKETVFGKRLSTSELPWLTAQVGDKGSLVREKQRERAMIGNAMLLPAVGIMAGLWAFGDDEDGKPWFDVSGARYDIPNLSDRNSPADKMEPYTIKIGGHYFKYNTKPALLFAAGWLGAYRDMQRAGMKDDEAGQRMKMMGYAYLRSLLSLSDLQIAGGFRDLNESISQLVTMSDVIKQDPHSEEMRTQRMLKKFGKFMAKKQTSVFTNWLPTKNNFLQQTAQFIDPSKTEAKGVGASLMYNLGIHKLTNMKAIDVFGHEVYSYPGYTNIYYNPLLEKKQPEQWDTFVKLSKQNAVPATPSNTAQMIIGNPNVKQPDGRLRMPFDYIIPDDKEFWTFRKMAGNKFYADIVDYQNSEAWEIEKNRKKSTITGDKTVLQDRVSEYWSNAKQQARDYLFTWGEFRQQEEDLFKALYDNDAIPTRISSIKIPDIRNNEVYRDKDGNIVVADEISVSQQDMFGVNARVMDRFIGLMRNVPTNSPIYKLLAKENWEASKAIIEAQLAIEQLDLSE